MNTQHKKDLFLETYPKLHMISRTAKAIGVTKQAVFLWLKADGAFLDAFDDVKKELELSSLEEHLSDLNDISFDKDTPKATRAMAHFFYIKAYDARFKDKLIEQKFTGDIVSGYRYTLYLGIVASILALIPFSMVKANPPSAEERNISFNMKQIKSRGGFYFKITIANFIVGLGAGLIIPFLNLYFRDRFSQPPDRITFFYFLAHLVMLIGIMIGPIMAKKIGLVRAVVTAQLSSIPFMLILSYSDFLPLVLLAFVLRAGLMNIGVPIITNLAMELSEKSEQGLVSALLIVAWTSALMISSAFGGVLIEHYGYTVTINITIVIYLLSTLIFYSLFKNVETRQNGKQRWTLVREAVS